MTFWRKLHRDLLTPAACGEAVHILAVINLKTAKTLSVMIPPIVRMPAQKVIK